MRHSLILLALLPLWAKAQQLPHTMAFRSTLSTWNPAMTAPWTNIETQAVYHQQWLGFEGAPATLMADFQAPLVPQHMSLGLRLQQDETGPLQQTGISLSYAYQLELGYNQRLAIGIMANGSRFRFDATSLNADDPSDLLLGSMEGSSQQLNFGMGIFYTSTDVEDYDEPYFFAGLAAQQLVPGELRFETVNELANFNRSFHGFGLIGYHFEQDYSFIETSLQVLYAANNITHFQLGIQYEQYDTFWMGLSLDSSFRTGLQLGYILSDVGEGSLRIGTMASYSIQSRGQEQGMSLQALVGYQYEL
ncbi:MAG: PorP/SprF family type IX secretion system membrane protein [Bacteroidota bacterium]